MGQDRNSLSGHELDRAERAAEVRSLGLPIGGYRAVAEQIAALREHNRQLQDTVQVLSAANREWAQAVNIRGLRELQGFVNRWQRATFPKATATSTFIHMCREVNELRAEINKFALLTGPGQRGTGVKTEIGDVGILLMAVCDMVGVDLASAITDKMAENLEREWGEPDAQGVVEHKR